MFFYFIHCSLGTGPGSAVGERGIKRETAKKSAREANRTLHWRGKREAELRQPPPFPLPKLPLGSLCSPIFFLDFSPHFGACPRPTFTAGASLFYIRRRFGSCLYRKKIEERCSGKEVHPQPSHGEKLSRENRVTPQPSQQRLFMC